MLTTLDMINDMLAASGTSPVTADDEQHPSYVKAWNKLRLVSNSVQNLGLWFNTNYVELLPNTAGEVLVPAGTLHVDPVDPNKNFVKRGNKLWNQDNNSFVIGGPVKVKLVRLLDFEEIPEPALQYILAKARYEFYMDEDGTEPKLGRYERNKDIEWATLYREHLRNRDTNYFNGPNAALSLRRGIGRRRLPGPQE